MSQLERLQTLLQRVQRNRAEMGAERAVSANGFAQTAAQVQQVPAQVAARRMASGAPAPISTSALPAPISTMPSISGSGASAAARTRSSTPLEQAVVGQVAERAITAMPSVPEKAPAVSPAATGPARIEAQLPAMDQPVAQVIAPPPPVEDTTFGDLLRRSLALRPR